MGDFWDAFFARDDDEDLKPVSEPVADSGGPLVPTVRTSHRGRPLTTYLQNLFRGELATRSEPTYYFQGCRWTDWEECGELPDVMVRPVERECGGRCVDAYVAKFSTDGHFVESWPFKGERGAAVLLGTTRPVWDSQTDRRVYPREGQIIPWEKEPPLIHADRSAMYPITWVVVFSLSCPGFETSTKTSKG